MNIPSTIAMKPTHWRQLSRSAAAVMARTCSSVAAAAPNRPSRWASGPRVSTSAVTDRPARSQPACAACGRIEHELDRHALHHLGEVAGGVLRRQQAEQRAGRRRQAVHPAVHRRTGIDVRDQPHLHARLHAAQLRLLEVGDDVELLGQRRDGDELRGRRHMLAEFGGAVAGDAVERRADHGVGEVVLAPAAPRRRRSAGAPWPARPGPAARQAAARLPPSAPARRPRRHSPCASRRSPGRWPGARPSRRPPACRSAWHRRLPVPARPAPGRWRPAPPRWSPAAGATWRCAVSTAAAASAAAAVAWASRARQSVGSSTISGSPAWTRWLSATLMAATSPSMRGLSTAMSPWT